VSSSLSAAPLPNNRNSSDTFDLRTRSSLMSILSSQQGTKSVVNLKSYVESLVNRRKTHQQAENNNGGIRSKFDWKALSGT
jgi:hypothetical protein